MKILMTADAVGGVWTYALELCRELAGRGVRTVLATMGPEPADEQRAAAESIAGLELYASQYRLEWMQNASADVIEAGDWLLDLERIHRPDLIHLNNYAQGSLAWRAPLLVVGHSCVLSWFRAVRNEDAGEQWREYQESVTRGLRGADLVVAPSAAMLSELQRHYGPLGQTAVIPNGTDPACYRPAAKEPLVLTAGRIWDEAKNVAALAAVADRLAWPVYVAGDARHPDGGGSPPAGVHLLGGLSRDALASWYARAAVYVLPARYEPFGLSALEAALAGCALVLNDLPSLREIWGDAALFVQADDRDRLTAALQSLLAEPAERARRAEMARARALRYTSDRMGCGYLAAYRKLLGGRARHESTSPGEERPTPCVS
jgi:glycosyltransferase involved in cell wall biosynthesis